MKVMTLKSWPRRPGEAADRGDLESACQRGGAGGGDQAELAAGRRAADLDIERAGRSLA